MSEMDISPEVFTADFVGEPGRRTFFLQSRSSQGTSTYLIEKQQVALLAEKLSELLLLIDNSDTIKSTPPTRDPALVMNDPTEVEWRVGTIGLAYDEDDDRVVVVIQPVVPEEEEEEVQEPAVVDEPSVRFFLRRDQARAFILHTVAVVAEGRPTCQLCGLPIDPEGHACPASNGHRG